mgnify:CR=1 FL=1
MASFADSANVFLCSDYVNKQFIPNPTTQRGAGVHLNFNPKIYSNELPWFQYIENNMNAI